MYGMLYVLDKHNKPQIADNPAQWSAFFSSTEPVGHDEVGNAVISTIFLGVDQNYWNYGAPVLWETRVAGGALDGELARYPSLAEAKKGHLDMVARVARSTLLGEASKPNNLQRWN